MPTPTNADNAPATPKAKDLLAEALKHRPVSPPKGYVVSSALPSLSETPAFIRNSVDMSKVRQTLEKPTADDVGAVADVHSDDPNHIRVFDQKNYNAGNDLSHEATHVFQFSRNKDLPEAAKVTGVASYYHDPYDYSGLPTTSRDLPYAQQIQAKITGLQKARNEGKTIANFNTEQQAEMVKDYQTYYGGLMKKVQNGTATPADLKQMAVAREVFHPFIQELANMPGNNVNLQPGILDMILGKNMPTINTHPAAPGLPPTNTPGLGVAEADSLLGGKSLPLPLPKR